MIRLLPVLVLAAEALSFKERLIYLLAEWSYLGVFAFLVACGLGFPSPEEVALIGGGYAVYKAGGGWGACLAMVAVAMLGVLVGDVILYSIGRRVGESAERVPIIGRHLTPDRMEQARGMFQRHGAKAVFFGRFLFGIRAVTFFVSGSMRVPLTTFVLMDGLAALISVPISVILAWHFGGQLELAFLWIGRLDRVILVVVSTVLLVAGLAIWRRLRTQPVLPGATSAAADGAAPAEAEAGDDAAASVAASERADEATG